jgi:transcriptional regulator with GAF, ATPase, and Fis domain
MELQTTELILPLFFLCALMLVARFKRQLSSENREGYRSISGGLVILTLMILSNVYQQMGIFDTLPFVSEPLFYQLFFWIGIITGLTFLISGMAHWLPLSHSYRRLDSAPVRRLEFIKKVSQLVGVEKRLPVILSQTLQYMVEHFGFLKGAVYVFAQKRKTLIFIASAGTGQIAEPDLKRIEFENDCDQKLVKDDSSFSASIIKELPPSMPIPGLALPLIVTGKLSGLFLLWHDQKVAGNHHNNVDLKLAVDIIARKVELDKLRLAEEFRNRQQAWLQSFSQVVDSQQCIKDSLPQMAKWIKEKIPAELISMTIIYDGKNLQRLTVGPDGTLLAEKGLDLPSDRFLEYLLKRNQPLVLKDVRYKTTVPIDKMIYNAGMRSLVAFPLVHGRMAAGCILLASPQANRFTRWEIELMKNAIPWFENLAASEIYRARVSMRERRLERLVDFLSDCGRTAGLQELFQKATELLSQELKTSVVRISTYENGGTFLKSRALSVLRPIEGIAPADGHMILSLMPNHEQVRDTGQLMLINPQTTDREIAEAEATQIATRDLKSALLIPVKVDEEVVAVISLAETRSWNRYPYSEIDILFASSIAKALSLTIQTAIRDRANTRVRPSHRRLFAKQVNDSEVRSHIKSSLAGILGSVELIKSRQTSPDQDFDRYLSIIDRSAQKISDYFTEEVSL